MPSDTYTDTTVRDGVVGLIVPPEARILGALSTPSARALLERGAHFYTLPNGSGMLALSRPPGGIPTAISLREFYPEAA